jgi:hypothetical protein
MRRVRRLVRDSPLDEEEARGKRLATGNELGKKWA